MPAARLFIPDGLPEEQALARTTHMAITAHQDDLEIMAAEGIVACFQQPDRWFTGVVVTNGAGSPRDGLYRDYTDEQMRAIRARNSARPPWWANTRRRHCWTIPARQSRTAPTEGRWTTSPRCCAWRSPQVVYTHNLADKHDTHVGVTLRVIEAHAQPAGRAAPASTSMAARSGATWTGCWTTTRWPST